MKKILISSERQALWAKYEEGSVVSAGAMNLDDVYAQRRQQGSKPSSGKARVYSTPRQAAQKNSNL